MITHDAVLEDKGDITQLLLYVMFWIDLMFTDGNIQSYH